MLVAGEGVEREGGAPVRTFEAGRLANQLIWLATAVLEVTETTFDRLVEWGQALAAAVDETVPVGPGGAP